MLLKAQTACSHTFELDEDKNLTNGTTAPDLTTCLVRAEVPQAMFVKALRSLESILRIHNQT